MFKSTLLVMLRARKIQKIGFYVLLLATCFVIYVAMRTPRKLSALEIKPCVLEKLDPWDKSLTPFFVTPPRLNCSRRKQLMYVDKDGVLQLNKTVLKTYGLDRKILTCKSRAMNRVLGDQDVTFDPEIVVTLPVFVKSHVFRVSCTVDGKIIYDYLHFNFLWNSDAKPTSKIEDEGPDHLSLIVFGIDSVSRSHAVRFLPKSYKCLLEEFQAYDFEGYSKVGENTWPNLVPLLTGRNHRDFPMVSHLYLHADTMPLLWNEEAAKKMASFFAEDRPDISTFNFVKGGFKHQPTDYFFRPYTLGMHTFEPTIIKPLGKPSFNCYGVDNYFDIQVEYLKGFLSRYNGKRKFAYFWNNQVCHEDFTTLSREDDAFLAFLHWMKDTGQTKNAMFLTLSDHGFRIGGASLTHVGRAENNKPWLMLHVPKHIIQKYSWLHKTLLENSKRLVTHYDIYQTMLDMINNSAFEHRSDIGVQSRLVRRNIFSPIPILRTCADAGIEEKYCACEEKVAISTTTDVVQSMAEFLVNGINKILSEQLKLCNTLALHDVTEVSVVYSNSDAENLPDELKRRWIPWLSSYDKQDTTGRYFILFHTKPGNAYFEGTVDFTKYSIGDSDQHMTMIGEPSRLDRYGNQSFCMNDSFLRLYCYCKGYNP